MSVRWPLLTEGHSANVTELLAMADVGDVLVYTLQSLGCAQVAGFVSEKGTPCEATPPNAAASLPVRFASAAGVISERDLTRSIAKARALMRQGRLQRSQTVSHGGEH